MTNEELQAIRERAEEIMSSGFQNYEYSPLRYFFREDIPKLLAEIERLKHRISYTEELLSYAHDWMDDTHGYDSDVYRAISEYFSGGDNE